jgi:predicted RNA binding protein YcfA (HicA-like mRNA interferase family)
VSEIDYAKLRFLTTRELVSTLIKEGFYIDRQSGSHQQYCHQDGRRVTVSFHRPGDIFSPKILKIMLEKQAKWTEEDLKRLGLLK